MGKLVLLLVAAAWAAVLIPPLLRSRIENRPNNSVSDFRNQLSSLQRAMPSRTVQMRAMARPLVSSPLERPAAAGRPGDTRGARRHSASLRSHGTSQSAQAGRPGYEREPGRRLHGDRQRSHHRPVRAREVSPRDAQKRRRANVLFVLVVATACSLFLALTTETTAVLYLFALSFLALASYVYMLGQSRQRDVEPSAPRSVPRPRERWLDVA